MKDAEDEAFDAIEKAQGWRKRQIQEQERNFCPRCGKRLGSNDWDVHTCTPPQPEQEQCSSCGGFCKQSGCERADYVPPKREWVGLTDEEMEELWENKGWYVTMFKAVEAKLKEKNT